MTNIGSKFKVAGMFPTNVEDCILMLNHAYTFSRIPVRQRQRSLQSAISCDKYLACNMTCYTTCFFLSAGLNDRRTNRDATLVLSNMTPAKTVVA
eukprot:4355813-Pleurochrysis_carterae.AAC.3